MARIFLRIMKRFYFFLLPALGIQVLSFWIASGSLLNIGDYLIHENALKLVIISALGFALSSFLAGFLSKDYSWVDRLWSTLPLLFVWFYTARSNFSLPLLCLSLLISLWGLRLTWNFARKGGYSGTEDYRWAVLRKKITNPLLWQLFNLFFISIYQIGLFVLFTLPVYLLQAHAVSEVNLGFMGACVLILASILIETKADQEQWHFQKAKAAYKAGKPFNPYYKEDIERGFLSTGLFRYSRHPNYFGELAVWWSLGLASSALLGTVLNWGLLGPLMLSLLFLGSTKFTENLSSQKYAAYASYKKQVSAIIPCFSKKPFSAESQLEGLQE